MSNALSDKSIPWPLFIQRGLMMIGMGTEQDSAGRLARLEGERETLLRANEALRATLAKAQADDT